MNQNQRFDIPFLTNILQAIANQNQWEIIRIHGECYGNKQQKMNLTNGDKLKFAVFDIKIDGEKFLNQAEKLTCNDYKLGKINPNDKIQTCKMKNAFYSSFKKWCWIK